MIFATIATIALFVAFAVVVAKVGGGDTDGMLSVFRAPAMPPRPRGVQEDDLPPFVFKDPQSVG
jgi:hypothetical protein